MADPMIFYHCEECQKEGRTELVVQHREGQALCSIHGDTLEPWWYAQRMRQLEAKHEG